MPVRADVELQRSKTEGGADEKLAVAAHKTNIIMSRNENCSVGGLSRSDAYRAVQYARVKPTMCTDAMDDHMTTHAAQQGELGRD